MFAPLHTASGLTTAAILVGAAIVTTPTANADNKRLNNSVVANVYTVQHQAGCTRDVTINPQLRLAAQWHTLDVLNNRALDGDVGTDGSTINGIEIMQQWYSNPAYLSIMQDCSHTVMGVWSLNSLDRSVVVAVYGAAA